MVQGMEMRVEEAVLGIAWGSASAAQRDDFMTTWLIHEVYLEDQEAFSKLVNNRHNWGYYMAYKGLHPTY